VKSPSNEKSQAVGRNWQIVKLLLRILVTAGLLFWVFSRIDLQEFWQSLQTAKWQYLIGVWAATIFMFWINSLKLKLILKTQDFKVSTAKIFGINAVTTLYGMVMPGMLSWAVKWYLLIKGTGKGAHVFSGLVYNQLSTMVVMVVFGLGTLAFTNPVTAGQSGAGNRYILPVVCILLLAAVVAVSILLLCRRTGGKIIKGLEFLLKPLPVKIRQKASQVLTQIAVFQEINYRFHILMAVLSIIGTVIGGLFMYMFAAKAANINISVMILVWLWTAIFILQRVPISVANLGVREATITSLLALYGVENSAALLMSMLIFSSTIFMVVVGAIINFTGLVDNKSMQIPPVDAES
jgi:glycosyltransferase 2 family protein